MVVSHESNFKRGLENFAKVADNESSEAKAQAIIISGVADSHLEYLKEKTAYEMFKKLEENFKTKGVRSRIYLRRKLTEEKYCERKPLMEHFIAMEEIFSQLKDAGNVLTEEEKINYVLLSMPRSYENVITA